MSNLTGFNVGANQRGILNLGSTINTPLSATLQSVTDGMGVASPLQLSTSQIRIDSGVTNRRLTFGSNGQMTFVNDNDFIIDYSSGTANIFRLSYSGTSVRLNSDGYQFSNYSSGTTYANLQSVGLAIGQGVTAASARLHVRGDGTNPVARFESSAGSPSQVFRENSTIEIGSQGVYISTTANGVGASNSGRGFLFVGVAGQSIHQFNFAAAQNGETSGTLGGINLTGAYAAASGTALYQPLRIAYTINNSGAVTGTATGIFLNATETALNGMTHNLIDLQRNGVTMFSVERTGRANLTEFNAGSGQIIDNGSILFGGRARIYRGSASGSLLFTDENATGNNVRFQFGGTTNAFPALKRNGAALEVRLADDSGYGNLNTAQIFGYTAGGSPFVRFKLGEISGGQGISTRDGQFAVGFTDANQNSGFRFLAAGSGTTYLDGWSEGTTKATNYRMVFGSRVNNTGTSTTNSTTQENGTPCIFGFDSHDASAIVQINSTTRGFLPPRQTEAQRLNISSPAVGLMVYQTDATDGLYVYKAGGWQFIA